MKKYYASITKIFAIATLVVAVITLAGGVYAPFDYHWVDNSFSATLGVWSFLLTECITFSGGFLASLAISRHQTAPHSEKIIKAGAYGLLAYFLYSVSFNLLVQLNLFVPGYVDTNLTALEPLLAFLVIATVAYFDRHTLPFLRTAMGIFIFIFWVSLLLPFIQFTHTTGYILTAGDVAYGGDYIAITLTTLLIPVIVAVSFYAALRKIGRLARVFYASYTSALAYMTSIGFFQFYWSSAGRNFSIFVGAETLILTLALFVALIRVRRLKK